MSSREAYDGRYMVDILSIYDSYTTYMLIIRPVCASKCKLQRLELCASECKHQRLEFSNTFGLNRWYNMCPCIQHMVRMWRSHVKFRDLKFSTFSTF